MTASLAPPPPSVCVLTGTTLTVTFDKSAGGMGVPGPWTVPPVAVVDSSVLMLSSSVSRGHLLIAVLKADTAGAATVSAGFGEECSGGVTTGCTVPPEGDINVNVTVKSP